MTSKMIKGTKGLYAPSSYWQADKVHLRSRVNGCGPSSWPAWVVPDSLVGMDISEACYIHDYMYGEDGTTQEIADKTFLKNMKQLIKKGDSNFFLSVIKKIQAKLYYYFVRFLGKKFFKKSKK